MLYGISLGDAWPALVATMLLGAIGLAAVGTFYAGVTVRMAAREVMLPLLMLPIVAPLLLAAVKATTAAIAGEPARRPGCLAPAAGRLRPGHDRGRRGDVRLPAGGMMATRMLGVMALLAVEPLRLRAVHRAARRQPGRRAADHVRARPVGLARLPVVR